MQNKSRKIVLMLIPSIHPIVDSNIKSSTRSRYGVLLGHDGLVYFFRAKDY
jgi:hypothetical protein